MDTTGGIVDFGGDLGLSLFVTDNEFIAFERLVSSRGAEVEDVAFDVDALAFLVEPLGLRLSSLQQAPPIIN